MVLSQINNNWDKHRESEFFVGFENVEEIIILKETHGSVRNLQVSSSNASDNSLEKFSDEMFNLIDFTDFQHFLKFC